MTLFEEASEQKDFKQAFRKFVSAEITPHREEWEKKRAVPRALWIKMGEMGFLCTWLPEEYGGLNLDLRYSAIINEELAAGRDSELVSLFIAMLRLLAGNLLGEEGQGFKYMMECLDRERLEACVICQAMAEECFKEG